MRVAEDRYANVNVSVRARDPAADGGIIGPPVLRLLMLPRAALCRCALIPPLLCALGSITPSTAAEPPVYGTEECSAHPWPIPFATGQTTLSPFATQRLDKLATAWRLDGGPLLASGRVDGQEDRPGQALSSQRLTVVLKALEDHGVPGGALWGRDDHGAAGVAPNVTGQPEPQNRTVWIEMPNEGTNCARRLADQRRDWVAKNCLAGGHGDPATCRSTLELLN